MNKAQIKKHMREHDDKTRTEGTRGSELKQRVQPTSEKMIGRHEFNIDCCC